MERGGDVGKVFLTEYDVVTAWVLRGVAAAGGMSPERTMSFLKVAACFGRGLTDWNR